MPGAVLGPSSPPVILNIPPCLTASVATTQGRGWAAMHEYDECDRCGHRRDNHGSFAAGGCGSRVRVAGRGRICGCAEFREPFGALDETELARAGQSDQALAGLS